MKTKYLLILTAWLMTSLFSGHAGAKEPATPTPMVRIAEIEIHPALLEKYVAELKEEIEASIRLEPGVLTLYAVAEKENPTRIRIFETYADDAAYRSHIETPHFKKYKTNTQEMVKSLKLVETVPILLGIQPQK